jgi:hypothetical protein
VSDLVADAHSDLLMELLHAEDVLSEHDPLASRWLPVLQRGGVGLQVCALYVDPADGPERGSARCCARRGRTRRRGRSMTRSPAPAVCRSS